MLSKSMKQMIAFTVTMSLCLTATTNAVFGDTTEPAQNISVSDKEQTQTTPEDASKQTENTSEGAKEEGHTAPKDTTSQTEDASKDSSEHTEDASKDVNEEGKTTPEAGSETENIHNDANEQEKILPEDGSNQENLPEEGEKQLEILPAEVTSQTENIETEVNVYPIPQSVKSTGNGFEITSKVNLVVSKDADTSAVNELKELLNKFGIEISEEKDSNCTNIFIGQNFEDSQVKDIISKLNVESVDTIKDEGYILYNKKDSNGIGNMYLIGKDDNGTFYAVQTLKKMLKKSQDKAIVPEVEIKDYPSMKIRGSIEGFYGEPWSKENRISQFKFYAENKMNTYIYSAKNDDYLREKWHELYPEKELNDLKAIVDAASENHVNFVYAISPGLSIKLVDGKVDNDDLEKLKAKAQQAYDIGVRSFAIFLDDIPITNGEGQVDLLNRFQKEFIETHDGCKNLITIPTIYVTGSAYVNGSFLPYVETFANNIDQNIVVMWTGKGAFPVEITKEDMDFMKQVFKNDMLIWYNYPVNDYSTKRLFMGPVTRLSEDLNQSTLGITSNSMVQSEASKIPLFTLADYSWNTTKYNPEESFKNAAKEIGGEVAEELKLFAGFCQHDDIGIPQNVEFINDIKEFINMYRNGTLNDQDDIYKNLLKEFENMVNASEDIRNNINNDEFIKETDEYLKKFSLMGQLGQVSVKLLCADNMNNEDIYSENASIVKKIYEEAQLIPITIPNSTIETLINLAFRLTKDNRNVAYWSFDEGKGNNVIDSWSEIGATLNDVEWTPLGKIRNALQFDGKNSYININDTKDIGSPWTAGMWVRRDKDTECSTLMSSGKCALKLEQYPNTHSVGFTKYTVADATFNYSAPIGKWVHLTFTCDGLKTCLYVNGKLQDSKDIPIDFPMERIGASCNGNNPGDLLLGALDGVKVFDKVLSEEEIKALVEDMTPEYKKPAEFKVTASSSIDGWEVEKLSDNNGDTVWSSVNHENENGEEWVMFDAGKQCKINSVSLSARVDGLGFPKDFKFQYSDDKTNWNDIEGQDYKDYREVDSHETIKFKFEKPVTSRYFRMLATKLRADGQNHFCQIADFIVNAIEIPTKEEIAEEAVVRAETSKLQAYIDAAKTVVTALPDGETKNKLLERLNNIVVVVDEPEQEPEHESKGNVVYWNFDEGSGDNITDSCQNIKGTLNNATWISSGKTGSALQFDGAKSYVDISEAKDISTPWTANMKVFRDKDTETSTLISSKNSCLKLEQYQNTHKVGFTKYGFVDIIFDYSVPLNKWVNLTFTCDGTKTSLYVNGELKDSKDVAIDFPMKRIGATCNLDKPGDFLSGAIDEVKVFDKVLNEEEIKKLADNTEDVTPPVKVQSPLTITSQGKLDRTAGITASVSVAPTKDADAHEGNEVVVFQLMKGNTPQNIVALQKDVLSEETLKAHFNVSDFNNSEYSVKVFVLDKFNSDISAPKSLAEPVELK